MHVQQIIYGYLHNNKSKGIFFELHCTSQGKKKKIYSQEYTQATLYNNAVCNILFINKKNEILIKYFIFNILMM